MENIANLQQELDELSKKLEIISETLNKIRGNDSDDEIGVGSKVELKYPDGKTIEGRVWRVKRDGNVAINREGYKQEILWKISELKHLSVGTYGKLEKQQWLLQQRIENIKKNIIEEINKTVFGIKEILRNEIDFLTAKEIINRKDFQTWYNANKCDDTIPLTEINKASPIFICGLAREFIIAAPDETIYQSLILAQSKYS